MPPTRAALQAATAKQAESSRVGSVPWEYYTHNLMGPTPPTTPLPVYEDLTAS